MRRRPVIVALGVAVAFASGAAAWAILRSEPEQTVAKTDPWIPVITVELARANSVTYIEEHEMFVIAMGDKFIALSAWPPGTEKRDDDQRVLSCTVSNFFESGEGAIFDRVGFPREGPHNDGLERIPVRVREGAIKVAPSRAKPNNAPNEFGGFEGPPCGEWGDVVESSRAGYALATEKPAEDNDASMHPRSVQVEQRARLRFEPDRQTSGLLWHVFRFEDPLWRWKGFFVGGPRWPSKFYLGPSPNIGVEDVGFGGRYTMKLRIPKLPAGSYRLMTETIRAEKNAPLDQRLDWHFADFEVVD